MYRDVKLSDLICLPVVETYWSHGGGNFDYTVPRSEADDFLIFECEHGRWIIVTAYASSHGEWDRDFDRMAVKLPPDHHKCNHTLSNVLITVNDNVNIRWEKLTFLTNGIPVCIPPEEALTKKTNLVRLSLAGSKDKWRVVLNLALVKELRDYVKVEFGSYRQIEKWIYVPVNKLFMLALQNSNVVGKDVALNILQEKEV
ncbi:MAG: hypothetical protein QXO44_02815 [Thermoplasmatales archaeon]